MSVLAFIVGGVLIVAIAMTVHALAVSHPRVDAVRLTPLVIVAAGTGVILALIPALQGNLAATDAAAAFEAIQRFVVIGAAVVIVLAGLNAGAERIHYIR